MTAGKLVAALIMGIGIAIAFINAHLLLTQNKIDKEGTELDLSKLKENKCPYCGKIFYTYKGTNKGYCYYCNKVVTVDRHKGDTK